MFRMREKPWLYPLVVIVLVLVAAVAIASVIHGRDPNNATREVAVDTDGKLMVSGSSAGVFQSDTPGNCVAITNASVAKTLPTTSDYFRVCAWGNTAYVLCDATPTATMVVTTGFSFMVADGQCHDLIIEEAQCAVIGASTAGNLCFMNMVP
jgi:hypothetical protein